MLYPSLRTWLTQTTKGKIVIRKTTRIAHKISEDGTSLRILMLCIFLHYSELSLILVSMLE